MITEVDAWKILTNFDLKTEDYEYVGILVEVLLKLMEEREEPKDED